MEADSVSCWIAPRDVAGGRPYSGDLLTNLSNAGGVGRSVLLMAFVERVARLGGTFITGEDIGTTVADIEAILRAA